MEFPHYNRLRLSFPWLKKLMLAMKLTFIIILVGCLHISAATVGQTITISEKNTSLEKVLNKIEQQSGYTFWYKTDLVKRSPKVSLDVKNYSLEASLDACFKNLPITYTIVQKTIVLKAKEQQAVQTQVSKTNPVSIKGKVIDDTNAGLPGVTVRVKGTNIVVVTDVNGLFTITVPDNNAILVFTSIGFIAKEVPVGQNPMTVKLSPDVSSMNEVVVTALGIKREARSLGYSAQTISGADMNKVNPPDIATGLMGKIAGLNITQPNGVEGASTRIVIRGNNNLLGNNQALIVIDGVIINNEPVQPKGVVQSFADATNGGNTDVSQPPVDNGSFLNSLNPDDIESIDVLKGPTAAALYGARGANGVILIVSKKGGKKSGFGVDYSYTYRVNDP